MSEINLIADKANLNIKKTVSTLGLANELILFLITTLSIYLNRLSSNYIIKYLKIF